MIGVSRESLDLDDSGDLWLVREVGEWVEVRPLGRCDRAEFRVPDHLEAEYRRLREEFEDRVAFGGGCRDAAVYNPDRG